MAECRRWWAVVSDMGPEFYKTREAARRAAQSIWRLPDMTDRRTFGPYNMGGATGEVQVRDLGITATPRRELRRRLEEQDA